MDNETITAFTNQPYLEHSFNEIVNEVVNSVVSISEFNTSMENSSTASYTESDLEYLQRKVAYLTTPPAFIDLKSKISDKLKDIDADVVQKYMEMIAYLESKEYQTVLNLENEAFMEFTQDVNTLQQLKTIKL